MQTGYQKVIVNIYNQIFIKTDVLNGTKRNNHNNNIVSNSCQIILSR